MGTYSIFTMDTGQLTGQANDVKDSVLLALEKDGKLTESAEKLGGVYAVMIHEPSWLGKLWMKAKGIDPKEGKGLIITIVKT